MTETITKSLGGISPLLDYLSSLAGIEPGRKENQPEQDDNKPHEEELHHLRIVRCKE
jgi:hypothetical protein